MICFALTASTPFEWRPIVSPNETGALNETVSESWSKEPFNEIILKLLVFLQKLSFHVLEVHIGSHRVWE